MRELDVAMEEFSAVVGHAIGSFVTLTGRRFPVASGKYLTEGQEFSKRANPGLVVPPGRALQGRRQEADEGTSQGATGGDAALRRPQDRFAIIRLGVEGGEQRRALQCAIAVDPVSATGRNPRMAAAMGSAFDRRPRGTFLQSLCHGHAPTVWRPFRYVTE